MIGKERRDWTKRLGKGHRRRLVPFGRSIGNGKDGQELIGGAVKGYQKDAPTERRDKTKKRRAKDKRKGTKVRDPNERDQWMWL